MKPNKLEHLTKSKTFCILPWIHLYASPSGATAPCCMAESNVTENGCGNANSESLVNIVNGKLMNNLRLNMVEGKFNDECKKCYEHENKSVASSRKMFNNIFSDLYEESILDTNDDGSLNNFKMRYFDIRFNNICNFKCRTCNAGCSSQWEQENIKFIKGYQPFKKNNNTEFFQEVIEQIPNMNLAYFAGGEPLITEQHYILLEEMIKSKKSENIILRYNTNLSNLNFKDKDLIYLWSKFKNNIDLHASIDHYGEKAEYIRHGTNWGQIKENILKIKKMPNVSYHVNTVLSIFNILTLDKFYEYMYENNLLPNLNNLWNLYNMSTPEIFTCHMLPEPYKIIGLEKLKNIKKFLIEKKCDKSHMHTLQNASKWLISKNLWEEFNIEFKNEINRVDKIRNENFREIFPELSPLLNL